MRSRSRRFSTAGRNRGLSCGSASPSATKRSRERQSDCTLCDGVRGSVLHLTMGRSLLRTAMLLVLATIGAAAAQETALPDAASFFAAARENLAKASRIQGRYAYKERSTEVHRNPFGKIGSGG